MLGKMRYFSTLHLALDYRQIEVSDDARQRSVFATLHEFVHMPFGLCNAPATFQRFMQVVLAGMVWWCCFVYIDDVLVSSATLEEHLSEVFLRLKPKKCMFLQSEVPFLVMLCCSVVLPSILRG